MLLLVYSADRKRLHRFLKAAALLPSDALTLELYRSAESFFDRLRQPVPSKTSALIVAGDTAELSRFLSMSDFLWNIRVILAVPDDSPETLDLARRLWPRYIAFGEGDFSDVAAVLKKMARGQKGGRHPSKGND